MYTASHIQNEKNRFAYVRAMSRCLETCRVNKSSIKRIRAELVKLRKDAPKTFMGRLELFSNTKKYYMLGIEHSLEVVESIGIRFDKGYSHADRWFIRSILGRSTNED
jgi:hypothetical protein